MFDTNEPNCSCTSGHWYVQTITVSLYAASTVAAFCPPCGLQKDEVGSVFISMLGSPYGVVIQIHNLEIVVAF